MLLQLLAISVSAGSVQGQFNYSALFSQTLCAHSLHFRFRFPPPHFRHAAPAIVVLVFGTQRAALEKFFHFPLRAPPAPS